MSSLKGRLFIRTRGSRDTLFNSTFELLSMSILAMICEYL